MLLNPSLSPPYLSHPTTSTLPFPPSHNISTTTTTTPPFLSTIASAVLKTTAKYPTATYRLVLISSPTGPTISLHSLTHIRITFSINEPPTPHTITVYKSITVTMTHLWSVWEPPQFSPEEVPSDVGNMRLDVRMDLHEAWKLVWDQGVREAYKGVLLYWPCLPPGPGAQQPFYRFEVVGPSIGDVFVGAWTREVRRRLGGLGMGSEGLDGVAEGG